MLIALHPTADAQDESAAASQTQRTQLFHQSLHYAVTHPLVGVGPGQFAVAVFGDAVREGRPVVILESMKMEIPVLAENSGTLTKLAVAEGDVVQEGDLIAVIE